MKKQLKITLDNQTNFETKSLKSIGLIIDIKNGMHILAISKIQFSMPNVIIYKARQYI